MSTIFREVGFLDMLTVLIEGMIIGWFLAKRFYSGRWF